MLDTTIIMPAASSTGSSILPPAAVVPPPRDPDPAQPNVVTTDKSLHFMKYEIAGRRMTVSAIRSDGTVIESFEVSKPNDFSIMPWVQLLLLEE